MPEDDRPLASGTLGPAAVQQLRFIALARERLAQEETTYLGLIAEAQGFTAPEPVRFDYDLETATWTALPAGDVPAGRSEEKGVAD